MRLLNGRRFTLIVAVSFIAICLVVLPGSAQTPPASSGHQLEKPHDKVTLDAILSRLEHNIEDFDNNVPSFLCSEQIVSEMEPAPNGVGSLRTATSSTFLVRRSDDPDLPASNPTDPLQANRLRETHLVKTIDPNGFKSETRKKDEDGARMDSPYVVFGVFSGGLTRISSAGKACFHYRLHPAHKSQDGDRIVIDFETWPNKDRSADCPYPERMSGRGFIDPATMRVVHLDNTTYDAKGTWSWSVDYSPVGLSGKTFWLPTVIRSQDMSDTDTPADPVTHAPSKTTVTRRLVARYSDYRMRSGVSESAPDAGSKPAP